MIKSNQENLVGATIGISLGILLNAYLFVDVSFYGFLNQSLLLGFLWNLSNFLWVPPLALIGIFVIVQLGLTALFCMFLSSYFVHERKIVPPSFVLYGGAVPVLFILYLFCVEYSRRLQTSIDPMTSAFVPAFILIFFYILEANFFGSQLDRVVKFFVGAYCDEKGVEKNALTYNSDLEFEPILEKLTDAQWLRDYASLVQTGSPHKDVEKGEGLFRLNKIGTNHYLCVSVFKLPKEIWVLFTFYDLCEDRFGMEQRTNETVYEILHPQIALLKDRLKLADSKKDSGVLRRASCFTRQARVRLLERIAPYRLHVSTLVVNMIALGFLAYATLAKTLDIAGAAAIYGLILLVSIEFLKQKLKKD